MLLIHNEYVQVLAELGLTYLQAKVYLSLVCLKVANARSIQRHSNVARQDVYRILSELEEKDLIERIISKPTTYRPLSPNECISLLLQRRKEKNRQLQKKATQVFRNFKNFNVETQSINGNLQFILLSKSKTNHTSALDKLIEAVDNAQISLRGLLPFQLFMKVKYKGEEVWKKAVENEVKGKMIIGMKPEQRKIKLGLDQSLKNIDYFKFKWTEDPFSACVLLVDETKVFCRMGNDLEDPVLFSTAPCFVEMIKDYFEMKWNNALEFKPKQL